MDLEAQAGQSFRDSRFHSFPFKVNVLAFDRPQYLSKLLISLRNQTLPPDGKHLVFWVDGVNQDDARHSEKMLLIKESISLIKSSYPTSEVFISEQNLGIGLNYRRVEDFLLESGNSKWAVFLEDDFILHKTYFQALAEFIQFVDHDEKVVSVNCSGDSYNDLFNLNDFPIKIARHSWGYAQRFTYLIESRKLLDGYYSILEGHDYRDRDNSKIQKYLLHNGIRPVLTSQDSVKDVIRNSLGKISLTTSDIGLEYIGEFGVHFNSTIFQKNGFHKRKVSKNISIPKRGELRIPIDLLLTSHSLRLHNLSIQNFDIPLIHQRDEAIHQRDEAIHQRDDLTNSTIWRVTKPIRKFVDFLRQFRKNSLAKIRLRSQRAKISGDEEI